MKKILSTLLIMLLLMNLCGCGKTEGGSKKKEKGISFTEHITVEKLAVDNSSGGADSPLKLLYLFFTLNAGDENLEIDSTEMSIVINGKNTYESGTYVDAQGWMSSYAYTSDVKNVYVEESAKIMVTFQVPENDLKPGKAIVISDEQLPDEELLELTTDDIVFYDDLETMAKEVDPEGYAKESKDRADADADTQEKVKKALDGKTLTFPMNGGLYTLSFEDERFSLNIGKGFPTNGGTYSVKNKYIYCTYETNGRTVEIPYSWEDNGEIKLDTVAAFD